MKNIVLFGSGNGAKEYLLKNKDDNILALFDNDIKKHGTSFEGIKIYSPSKINSFNFDEIVIVSQWAKDIYEQLINELKLDKEKIIIPAKKDIKEANRPFEDKQTIELGRNIIKEFSKLAMQDNIVLYLDFGTLLGIVRDKDIIEWDDDIDFSVSNISKDLLDDWVQNSLKNLKFPYKMLIENKEFCYMIKFENSLRSFETTINLRVTKEDYSMHLPSKGMWYASKIHFEKYDIVNYQGQDVFVPYDYENYLTFLYGNWKIPKKDITMADYANLGKVEINKFI
ncbi:LicD family protein [Aliarcobacter skirrowii]|uniref:LicD family protein n=1 Tax=Aliarcobacter skirrowii TaxID=28200 RepID=UPI0029B3104F|nr:LicD family protein [Aliarcobacter skirrowii]MDX4062312.1 LicD family protein [Aliarcobacter skirrowii]